jgi:hypothetical protein
MSAHRPLAALTSVDGKRGSRICFCFREPCHGRYLHNQENCDPLRRIGRGGANLNPDKRKVLDQLIAKGFVVAFTHGPTSSTGPHNFGNAHLVALNGPIRAARSRNVE